MENAKILLVDDEQEIREIIRITLEKEGFMNVKEAGSVYETIQKCRNCIFDLIILDILLPDGSGFDICKTLREFTDAPIFFLTAKSSDLDKLSGFAMGADDYITKPFQPLEVVARIKAHLKRLQKNTYISNSNQDNCSFNFGYFKVFEESAQLIVEGETFNYLSFLFCSYFFIYYIHIYWVDFRTMDYDKKR